MIVRSNRALARQLGVVENSVRKALKAGRINREPNGSWDVEKVRAAWSANTDPTKKTNGANGTSFLETRVEGERLKIEERQLRLERMRAGLLDRARVVDQVFKLGRQERDAWLNWPGRIVATMAAELEVEPHQLHVVLDRYVREHLAELADIRFTTDG